MIRQMAPGDIDVICSALRNLKYESPYFEEYPEDEEHVHKTFPGMINTPGSLALIDEDCKGFMLGFVGCNWYSPIVEATEALLYVFEEYRGGRTAVALIRAFEQEARKYRAHCVNVGSSLGINDSGVENLYLRLGYSRKGHGLSKRLNYV